MLIDDYLEYQSKYEEKYGSNTIVLMEVGHFFEFYGIDNEKEKLGNVQEVSELLNIQMTRRNRSILENSRSNPLMAGFPSLAVQRHLHFLLANGYTIVLIEQVTPPPNPERAITNIYSPGTYINNNTSFDYNNILSIFLQHEKCYKTNKKLMTIGLSVIDLSTGQGTVYQVSSRVEDKSYALDETVRFIHTYNPREILIHIDNSGIPEQEQITKKELYQMLEISNRIIHDYPALYHKDFSKLIYQNEFLRKVYQTNGILSPIEFLHLENYPQIIISLIILLQYSFEHNENIINRLQRPIIWESNKYLILENNAINQLNLLNSSSGSTKYGSLFGVINNATTSIGRRHLKDRLLMPIIDVEELQNRYDLAEFFLGKDTDGKYLYDMIETLLTGIFDVERLHRKLQLKVLHPAEFHSLHTSYLKVNELMSYIRNNYVNDDIIYSLLLDDNTMKLYEEFHNEYQKNFVMSELHKYYINEITGRLLSNGISEEIDELVDIINDSRNKLDELAEEMNEQIDKNSNCVKVEMSDKDGHYLSCTRRRYDVFKKNYKKGLIDINKLRLSATANGYKITSYRIKELSRKIIGGIDKLKVISKEEYINLLDRYSEKYSNIFSKIVNFIGNVDLVKSCAKTSKMYNYCKPIIDKDSTESFVNAESIRHPIIERINNTEYIPNWVRLGADLEEDKIDDKQKEGKMDGMLLFSCNSLGKSSYMKSVGLSVIMAQMGMFVPASEFHFYPFKTLLTRIIGNDNLFKGQSSFAVEMSELRGILNRADKNSLVLGDEVCHGTEQTSGLAIVASSIIKLSQMNVKFIFATHLHQLSKMERIKELENVKNFHLKVIYDRNNDKLIYDRRLTPSSGTAIYGLEVARAMDFKDDFIDLANNIRKEIMDVGEDIVEHNKSRYNSLIYFKRCEICDKEGNDVHHIKFQSNADEDGFVDHRHKNHFSNLVILCKKCHQDVHKNKIEINGYLETTDGIKLDYNVKKRVRKTRTQE